MSVDVCFAYVSSSSGQAVQEEQPLLGLEDEDTSILRNVGSYTLSAMASHPRKHECSATPL
jgi:hypothetical protein